MWEESFAFVRNNCSEFVKSTRVYLRWLASRCRYTESKSGARFRSCVMSSAHRWHAYSFRNCSQTGNLGARLWRYFADRIRRLALKSGVPALRTSGTKKKAFQFCRRGCFSFIAPALGSTSTLPRYGMQLAPPALFWAYPRS